LSLHREVVFENEIVNTSKPTAGFWKVRALAVTHAEFILIHPFREGNGRLARLLNTLMALQAGLPALDYGGISGRKKRDYIAAIHAALNRNYAPLEAVFGSVLNRTLRGAVP
jgi:cell filamentation protein